jgi:hypothetical protein
VSCAAGARCTNPRCSRTRHGADPRVSARPGPSVFVGVSEVIRDSADEVRRVPFQNHPREPRWRPRSGHSDHRWPSRSGHARRQHGDTRPRESGSSVGFWTEPREYEWWWWARKPPPERATTRVGKCVLPVSRCVHSLYRRPFTTLEQ